MKVTKTALLAAGSSFLGLKKHERGVENAGGEILFMWLASFPKADGYTKFDGTTGFIFRCCYGPKKLLCNDADITCVCGVEGRLVRYDI